MTTLAFALLLLAAVLGYLLNRQAARAIRDGGSRLHSVISYHGMFSARLVLVPVLTLILFWLMLEGPVIEGMVMRGLPEGALDGLETGGIQLVLAEIKSVARGQIFGTPEDWKIAAAERLVGLRSQSDWLLVAVVLALGLGIVGFARAKVSADFRARQGVEGIVSALMIFCSTVAIFTTLGIILALSFETWKFFQLVSVTEFLFGPNWEPPIPIRADQIAATGAFGWLPVILGTIVITVVALVVAVPVGLYSAIYLNEFAPQRARQIIKPLLEILAGVPTVVYGFFAILVVAPAIRSFGQSIGLDVAPNTALAAGGLMGIMLIPFISSCADDALSAVPQSLRDGALGLGATRGEMMTIVLFPAALPGIVGGILLAVTLLIGDTSFDNPKTLAAFALGMMLFLVTLVINIFALRIVRKYREAYD